MDSTSTAESSPYRLRQNSIPNTLPTNSPPPGTTTSTARVTRNYQLDNDMDLSGAPFYFDPDDGLTTMEQALRIISNYSRPNVPSLHADDTVNCKEWLLYLKVSDISLEGCGKSVDVRNKVSISCNFRDSKHHLVAPNTSKSESWLNILCQTPWSGISSSKSYHEVIYNLYDFYGHDHIELQLLSNCAYLPQHSKIIATQSVPLCYFYDIQRHIDKTSPSSSSLYLHMMDILCQVQAADLCKAGISLPYHIIQHMRTHPKASHVAVNIHVKLQFRLVSLQQCCRLSLYHHPKSSTFNAITSTQHDEHVHELHLAAAYGPKLLLMRLLQSLARKSYLRRSMQLQSSLTSTSTSSCIIISHPKNALDLALAQGNYHNAKLMLERMGNLCFQGSLVGSRSCALHYAVFSGSIRCLELVLKYTVYHGPIPVRGIREYSARLQDLLEWRDENDFTPLLLACQLSAVPCRYDGQGKLVESHTTAGRTRVVAMLLRFRADCSVISSKVSDTALLLACKPFIHHQHDDGRGINMDVVRMLLRAKKSRTDISTILQSHPNLASNHSYRRWNCCFLWSCYFKFPSLTSSTSATPSHNPASSWFSSSSGDDMVELTYDELINSHHPYDNQRMKVRRVPLLFLKCDVFHKDLHHKTAFSYAVEAGNITLVKLMVSCGISYMDILDSDGNNIIHVCAKHGYDAMIDYIAEMEYDRYKKYRCYVQRYPLQLLHYRNQIFRMKNAVGLSPYTIALLNEQQHHQHHDISEQHNDDFVIPVPATAKLSAKIDYYSQLIYQPSVTSKLASDRQLQQKPFIEYDIIRDQQQQQVLLTVSDVICYDAEENAAPETKKNLASASTASWHPGPFSTLFSMLLPPSSGSGKHSGESYLKSTLQQPSTSAAHHQASLSPSSSQPQPEQADEDDDAASVAFEYDDEADDLAYEFSLATKGIVSQNYYSVAQYENAKILREDNDGLAATEAGESDHGYDGDRVVPQPAIAVIA